MSILKRQEAMNHLKAFALWIRLSLPKRIKQLFHLCRQKTRSALSDRSSPITVIIGNPPYNMGQINENDNNKNRKYKVMDKRVVETYSQDSNATLRNKLS